MSGIDTFWAGEPGERPYREALLGGIQRLPEAPGGIVVMVGEGLEKSVAFIGERLAVRNFPVGLHVVDHSREEAERDDYWVNVARKLKPGGVELRWWGGPDVDRFRIGEVDMCWLMLQRPVHIAEQAELWLPKVRAGGHLGGTGYSDHATRQALLRVWDKGNVQLGTYRDRYAGAEYWRFWN